MPGDGSLVLALLSVEPRLELFLKPVAKVGRELALVVEGLFENRHGPLLLLHFVLEADDLLRQPGRRLARQLGNPEFNQFV